MLAEEVSRLFDVAYQQDDQETVLVERLTQMAAEPASRESIC